MSAIIGGNVEEEYLWSCTLTGADKEYTWNPGHPSDATPMDEDDKDADDKDPSVKPGHRLLIKNAILMPTAKADEVTIVQIESEGYNKQKVVVPICAMKGGSDYQRYVDLLVPHNAKLSLMQGEGPINLVGSHCVDYYGIREAGEGDSEDEAEEGTADEESEPVKEKEEEKKKTPVKEGKGDEEKKTPVKEDSGSKKRKASADPPKSAEKKKKESPSK